MIFDAANPTQLREIGSFDTFLAPAADVAGTDGAWGVYPFLPSGTVVVSDITNGLFVLKDNTAALEQSAGRLGFVATALSAPETAGTASIRVQRNGGSAGAVSVDYATSDGTATAGVDYAPASGTLAWAAGDVSERTLLVSLLDDVLAESAETITLTLSNSSGGATLDGVGSTDFTITDNDAPAPRIIAGGGVAAVHSIGCFSHCSLRWPGVAAGEGGHPRRCFAPRRSELVQRDRDVDHLVAAAEAAVQRGFTRRQRNPVEGRTAVAARQRRERVRADSGAVAQRAIDVEAALRLRIYTELAGRGEVPSFGVTGSRSDRGSYPRSTTWSRYRA